MITLGIDYDTIEATAFGARAIIERIKEHGVPLDRVVCSDSIAGAHKDLPTAQRKITSLKRIRYTPKATARKTYDQLYGLYRQLHDSLGGLNKSADLSAVMKTLLILKPAARS